MSGVLVVLAVWELTILVPYMVAEKAAIGVDFNQLMTGTRRWLGSGSFYYPWQLAGPYHQGPGDILYPPTALYLFMPFTVLPAVIWWLVPLAAIAWAVWRFRPAVWAWPFLAFALFYPRDLALVLFGNPTMWVAAGVATGLVWGWPAVFAILKPSLGVFALIGVRRRSWWIALGVVVIASLPFAGLWLDYVRVVRNTDNASIIYSLQDLPIVLAPIVAWLGRREAGST